MRPLRTIGQSTLWAFFRDRPMEGAITLFTAILLAYVAHGTYQSSWAAYAAVLAGLTAALTRSDVLRFRALAFASLMLGLMVLAFYYYGANHGFMIFWIALALLLATACDRPDQLPTLRRNAAILLGLLMGFALLQKLRSAYYMEGDLLGELLVTGETYANLLGLIQPEWALRLAEYRVAADDLLRSPEAGSAALVVPPLVLGLAATMTISSLIAQGAMELALVFRRRLGWLFHLVLLGFVAMVYSTRNENVFLSMNCLLGYCLVEEETRAARPVYALAILYLVLASLIGLRPWIIG